MKKKIGRESRIAGWIMAVQNHVYCILLWGRQPQVSGHFLVVLTGSPLVF